MTSYVTREEYERLSARLDRLEKSDVKFTVTVDACNGSGEVNRLVKAAVAQAMRGYAQDFERRSVSRAARSG